MGMLIPTGALGAIFFWLRNLLGDVGTGITGIWINGEKTFKVLIYDIDTCLQGDVVWADADNQRLLGRSIIQNLNMKFFMFGKGSYICPYSRQACNFRLRRLSKDSFQLYLIDHEGKLTSNETWHLVG